MSYHHTRHWLLVGALTLAAACGDERSGALDSQGGSGSSSSGGDGRTTGGSSSSGTGGVSATTTEDAGSNSDSATMASTQAASDPTDGGDTTADPSGTASQVSTGEASTGDEMSSTSMPALPEECNNLPIPGQDPCYRLCKQNFWTLDADFDAGVLKHVDHSAPNSDQLQLSPGLLAGEWSIVRDGLDVGAVWTRVRHNHEPEGAVPAGTSIVVEVRAADIEAELAQQPWILAVDGALPELTLGRFIELRARLLITDPQSETSPVLSDICVIKTGD